MSSRELIDAQFDRATDYEEKLTMYRSTIGNVKSPRPGIWDMLGRAKWDAWAKHKDVDSLEAKWLYVDALMKVLRKYSDKTMAKSLVQELESYGGDPFNLVMSGSISRSKDSDSSDDERPYNHPGQPSQQEAELGSEDEGESGEDEAGELPNPNRPGSSLSLGAPTGTPAPSSLYPSHLSQSELASSPPAPSYPLHTQFRAPSQPIMSQFGPYVPVRPATRPTLERAVENVQSQIAALNERLETLETIYLPNSRSHSSLAHSGSTGNWPRRRSDSPHWDFDDLGMWSLVLNPIQRGIEQLRSLSNFFVKNENRTPSAIILRRLFLDASFLFCCLFFVRTIWRKSGARRRDVKAALIVLWKAILGTKDRTMVDRGI
ncbi:hypothetical protein CPB85DRAFT_1288101 [Mucidula mucida]|nr:hypothetical protein CPB85DRAFT_1288101 [Mucidula mucida]